MNDLWLVGVIVLLILLVVPMKSPPPVVAEQPSNWRGQFAVDLLEGLGNNSPTLETVDFIVCWTVQEDGSDGASNRNNPLNTTMQSSSVTMVINSDGVKGYATREDGLRATLDTLALSYYTNIVAALQSNNPRAASAAVVASPWAVGNYAGSWNC